MFYHYLFLAILATAYFVPSNSAVALRSQPAGWLAADKGYGVTVDLTQYYDDTALADTLTVLMRREWPGLDSPTHLLG